MRIDRKERKQEANREEIKEAARKLMAEHGTAGLSMRLIAKELDMTPAALYYYFDKIEALITALIVDNYHILAEILNKVQQNPEVDSISAKAWTVITTYRNWALANPVDYQLIFGNPIPGYQAPREVTVPAVIRAFSGLVKLTDTIIEENTNELAPEYKQVPPELETYFNELKEKDDYTASTLAIYLASILWTRMHGLVMPELTHHLQPTVGNTDAYYQIQMRNLLRDFGLKL